MLILVTALVLSFSSKASSCSIQCHIMSLGDDSGKIIVGPKDFKPIGGYTSEVREFCSATVSVGGKILVFSANDVFGNEVILSIRRGSKLLVSSNYAGNYGSLSYFEDNIKISCSK